MKLGLPFSISILFWYVVGLIRFFAEEIFVTPKRVKRAIIVKKMKKVAICIPAHNEEVVIAKTIKSIKRLVPAKQIYIVSDGSKDRTITIARSQKCNVLELTPGKGKAKALVALMKHFKLLQRYEFILFVDADTILERNYLKNAIKIFESDPTVAAIAGYIVSSFRKHRNLSRRKFFEAYRVRLNRLIQLFLVYGQTWKYMNVTPVIPGSCSIYRARALKKLQLDTPGIVIEDFNLAFQIHKKRLGRIAHHPGIYSIDQDPDNLRDYWNQVKRWNTGFYQTVRKLGLWPSFFWMSLGVFTFEVLVFSLFIVVLPMLVLLLTTQYYAPIINPEIIKVSQFVSSSYITLWQIVLLAFVIDYGLTLLVAVNDRKYKLLIYGLGFLFFSYINSLILLLSIPRGLLTKSRGRWTPPKRR